MTDSSRTELVAAYEEVASTIQEVSDRDLWRPMMQELLRADGRTNACLAYLEAQRTDIADRIRKALDRLDIARRRRFQTSS